MRTATTTTPGYRDTRIDVKLVLSGLWVSMLFVFAYVDILGLFRRDVLEAALDGRVASTDVTVDQTFLTASLLYVAVPTLMVVLSLVLRARVNRIVNLVVAPLCAVSVIASAVGEDWTYYLVGSALEVIALLAITRVAWRWPTEPAPTPPAPIDGERSRGSHVPVA
jgi:hypothetical protein